MIGYSDSGKDAGMIARRGRFTARRNLWPICFAKREWSSASFMAGVEAWAAAGAHRLSGARASHPDDARRIKITERVKSSRSSGLLPVAERTVEVTRRGFCSTSSATGGAR